MNVLSCVDAIDHSKSNIIYNPVPYRTAPSKAGTPQMVIRLVLDQNKVGNHEIFRLHQWKGPLIVSEKIMTALNDAGVADAIQFDEVATDSSEPGKMMITKKGKLESWSIEEREKWFADHPM